jgi:hypothetical protein
MAARTAVVAGTATAVSGRVARRQQNKYSSQDAQYVEQQAAAAQAGVDQQAAADDTTTQVQELAALHASGAVADEAFAAAEAQVLGI